MNKQTNKTDVSFGILLNTFGAVYTYIYSDIYLRVCIYDVLIYVQYMHTCTYIVYTPEQSKIKMRKNYEP